MANYARALHIFRRDLRLHDNTALIAALKSAKEVIPCFIFDKRQIEHNDYKSNNSIQFMLNSLHELDVELQQKQSRLYYFYGIAEDILEALIQQTNANAVFINRDYTPFSRERDLQLEKKCRQLNVDFHCYSDALLHEPEEVLKSNRKPYTIFTHFYNYASQLIIPAPKKNNGDNYFKSEIALENKHIFSKLSQKKNINLAVQGGRQEAIALLKKIKNLADYEIMRNIPARSATTKLSPHHKFGTISIRETYSTIIKNFNSFHSLVKELYWRDFFTHIAFHFPHVFEGAFHEQYNHLEWSKNEKHFRAWCEGRTGFPIVDAGMRELNTTGFMHNRVRMITASFLTKDLHIDWRLGEKYFAQQLVDYDPAVNNGNWQWVASTGCDAQPYFRIFNPWLQQQKFDPDCLYIKRYIPELALLPAKIIHSLHTQQKVLMTNYPHPIVDHAIESQKAKAIYKKALT